MKPPQITGEFRCELGESPVWTRDAIHFCDIIRGQVFRHTSRETETLTFPSMTGCIIPALEGGMVLGLENELLFRDDNGREKSLVTFNEDKLNHRCNDGKAGPRGRIWFGTMHKKLLQGEGRLYSYSPGEGLKLHLEGLTIPNGMAWSRDEKTFYFIDSHPRTLYAYDFNPEKGELSRPEVILTIPPEEGVPDGMCEDAEGMLWIAHWGGSRVCRYNPETGELLSRINFPARQTSSCAFGGPEWKELYVTSARSDLPGEVLEKEPENGALFRVTPGVTGLPPRYCRVM